MGVVAPMSAHMQYSLWHRINTSKIISSHVSEEKRKEEKICAAQLMIGLVEFGYRYCTSI